MTDPRRASTGHRPVMGPPETPGRVVQASPNPFPTLQFSPDLFSHANMGAATAPIYPQQRLFWDPSYGNVDATGSMQQYQDPFALSQNEMSMSFGSNSTIIPSFQSSQHLPDEQPYELPTMSRTMSTSYIDRTAFPGPFTTSPRVPPHGDDNPNMFLSSPARRFGNADLPPNQMANRVVRERPAYHHQIEESKREQEVKRSRKTDVKHPSVTRSVMEALRRPISPAKDSRPGLKRSLTHSGVGRQQTHHRQQSHVSFLDNMSNASGSTNRSGRNGRTSPLKSFGDGIRRPLSSNPSVTSKRTSLSLSIDENGVAKTIVTKMSGDLEMDLDDESSASEVSSRDESDFHHLRSQEGSFAAMNGDDLQRPSDINIVRTHGSGHSKNSSYSTMASSNSAWQSSRTSSATSAPNARGLDPIRGPIRRKTVVLDPMLESDAIMEDNAGPGDAQQALRAIIQDRSRSTSTQDGSVTNLHAMEFNSSPPIIQTQFSAFNASPTTITDPDLATPSTDRESFISNGSTRCICNSSTPDGVALMIQCDSCTKWLHTACVGIDSRRVPEVYVCVYCSQTPMRHGRIREPQRVAINTAASPLAHKSQRNR